jgi:hypothetical protein
LERYLYDPRENALEKLYDYLSQTASNIFSGVSTSRTPEDWDEKHERSVVFMHDNEFEGVPLEAKYIDQPYQHPEDRAPVFELSQLPDWAKERLSSA